MSDPDVLPDSAHRMTAAVWMVLLAVGLAVGIGALGKVELAPPLRGLDAWLDGRTETALNQAIKLPGQERIETANAAVRYRMLGDLGTQVALGCPQWMFYQDGLRAQPGTQPQVQGERLRLLKSWSEQLAARQVRLLVVAVPDKARIEAGHLCGRAMAPGLQAQYDTLARALDESGIAFADLRAVLGHRNEDMFFRTDVHMNPAGARLAAQAVARAALPLLGGAKGEQAFEVSPPGTPQPRMGDLLVLSGLKSAPQGWRPDIETVAERAVAPVRGGGLLDDTPPVQVLLAGSSNGLRSHFAEWLGMDLGREVWNLSMDGGQFSGAMLKALGQSGQWPQTLRLVIWEFSENTLSLPLTDDEKKALAQLPAAARN